MTIGICVIEFERTGCTGAYGRKNREVALKLATYRFCNFCLIIFFSRGTEWFMDDCYPILLTSIGGTNACEKLAEYMGIKSELQQFIVLYFHYSDCHQSPLHNGMSHSETLWTTSQSWGNPTETPPWLVLWPRRWLSHTCVSKILFVKHIVSQLRWSTLLMAAITFRPLVCVMRLVRWAI